MLLMTVLNFASACRIGKQQITHDVDFFESLMKIKLKKSNFSHKKMTSLSNFLSDLYSLSPSSINLPQEIWNVNAVKTHATANKILLFEPI